MTPYAAHALIIFSALSKSMKEDFAKMAKGFADQRSQDIMTWISTLNFSTKQNEFFSRRQEGTGRWFLEADAFKKWLNGTERTLWCPGLRKIIEHLQHSCLHTNWVQAGAGKTILMYGYYLAELLCMQVLT